MRLSCRRIINSLIALSLIGCVLISPAYGADAYVINDVSEEIPLWPALSYLEDTSRQLTLEEVRSKGLSKQFQPAKGHLNFGVSDSVYWLKLSLLNQTQTSDWRIGFTYANLDKADFFMVQSGKVIHHLESGDRVPIADRPVESPLIFFPLALKSNESAEIWIRAENRDVYLLPLVLSTPKQLSEKHKARTFFVGAFFGLMLVMVLYNLILYANIADRSYLYYCLHLCMASLYVTAASGYGTEYIWPESPEMNDAVSGFAIPAGLIMVMFVAKSFLQLPETAPRLNSVAVFIIGVLLFLPFVKYVSWTLFISMSILSGLLVISAVLYFTLYRWRQGFKPAKIFLSAWIFHIVGIFCHSQQASGLLSYSFFNSYAIEIASSIEAVMLAWALSYRLSQMKRESYIIEKEGKQNLALANERLQKALNLSNESNRYKDQFFDSISRELKSPLARIISSLESIKSSELVKGHVKSFDELDIAAIKMTQVVENMLLLAEIQSGHLVCSNRCFSVYDEITTVVENFEQQAAAKNIDLIADVDRQVPQFVMGHSDHLRHVIHQLVDNAIKFTHQGEITITVTLSQADFPKGEGRFIIHVRDTGIGIDKEKLETVFEAFQQEDAGVNQKVEGLGIGLTIVNALAAHSHFKIKLHAVVGEGTEFSIYVPFTLDASCDSEAVERHSEIVLVVEDNPVNQQVMIAMLGALGCTAIAVDNGEEAIVRIVKGGVDLVLMDCQMPVMDGLEATRRIRGADKHGQVIPIVAVTASADGAARKACMQAGMNDVLEKPVKENELKALLEKWLLAPEGNVLSRISGSEGHG